MLLISCLIIPARTIFVCLAHTRNLKISRPKFFLHSISPCNLLLSLSSLAAEHCPYTFFKTKGYGDIFAVWLPLPLLFTSEHLCSSSRWPQPENLIPMMISAGYLFSVRLILITLFNIDTTNNLLLVFVFKNLQRPDQRLPKPYFSIK